jgi:HD-like signal output (HDOD) protein
VISGGQQSLGYLGKLVKDVEKIPPFSSTVSKILELANNPRSSPTDLNRVISMDPTLTAKVLKLVNSVYFGLSRNVTSVVRAIIILGLNTIKNLALSTAVLGKMYQSSRKVGSFDFEEFWRHSLGCAVLARNLATRAGVPKTEREEFFIAGLIHDLGKILLCEHARENFMAILEYLDNNMVYFFEAEEDLFGITHGDIGALLALQWKLAPSLVASTRFHHHPERARDNREIVYCVHLADLICKKNQIGSSGDRLLPEIPEDVLDVLGLKEKIIKELSGELEEDLDKAMEFLKVSE